MVAADPLLIVQDVSKRYPQTDLQVLTDLSLDVDAGSALSIRGGNGVGKSTLLRVIAGMVTPDAGFVRVGGLSFDRQRAGYLRQLSLVSPGDRGLYARLTVRQHMDYWARLAFVPASDREAAIVHVTAAMGLEPLAARRVDRLSMGQRQRVRLALAFLHSPLLVLLDEPANSLDPEGLELLHEACGEVRARGGACLWVAPEEAPEAFAADHELVLHAGALEPA